VRKWFLGFGAFLLVVAFTILGRDGRQKRAAEDRELGHLIDGSKKSLEKAKKENVKAEAARVRAAEAADIARAKLDQIGAKDEDIADIVGDWNTDRVQ